ncbi:XRE family transcriptional regulator [Ensifer sp. ENS04]|nr:XRE family transcriptional regulator [Ensifer sp. ENS04]
MLINEQARRGQKDREAADEIGVLQQTFSAWKGGSIPRPNKYAAVSTYLNISPDMMLELAEEAAESTGSTKLPKLTAYNTARTYGRVSDRKEGRFKFDPVNAGRKRVPEGRYAVEVGTNVMEPALLYGTKIWLDPGIWPKVGNEVMAHAKGGAAWLGRLAELADGKAVVENAAGRFAVDNVEAVHVVVLAERIPA